MTVLLINAGNPRGPFGFNEKMIPMGLAILAAVASQSGHEVSVIDNFLHRGQNKETDRVLSLQPEFVGISSLTTSMQDALRIMEDLNALKEKNAWNGKIILGGFHASLFPETYSGLVDHLVVGPGEAAFEEILRGSDKNVFFREEATDLDALPFPNYEPFLDLGYPMGSKVLDASPIFSMSTSRGCPFHCRFCSGGAILKQKYHAMSPQRIFAEMEHLIQKYGARGIYFREDNFTTRKDRLLAFCEIKSASPYKDVPWMCETRADSLNEQEVKAMARAGCKAFYVGVESGSQRVLDLMKKGISVEQVRRLADLSRKYGIMFCASVMFGYPGETTKDRKMTVDLVESIPCHIVWRNAFVGLPCSEIYEDLLWNDEYQYIDPNGILYLKGHNKLAKYTYGPTAKYLIPERWPMRAWNTKKRREALPIFSELAKRKRGSF